VADAALATRTSYLDLIARGARRFLLPLIPLLAVIGIWWLVAAYHLENSRIYPTPPDVADHLVDILAGKDSAPGLGSSYENLWVTLYRLGFAFLLAFGVGSALGLVAGRVKHVFDFFDNLAWLVIAVPEVVWAFVLVVAIGISDSVPITAVALLLSGVVFINVAEGSKSFSSELTEMASSYKATTLQRIQDVYIPQAVPYLLGSARIAFAIGVKLIVIAEIVGLSRGVGFQISYWHTRIWVAPIVAWGIVLVAVVLIVEYLIFAPLESRVQRWKR
jgi:ABC-type nitrate/sulfonate/bicarbonate transport system permease component